MLLGRQISRTVSASLLGLGLAAIGANGQSEPAATPASPNQSESANAPTEPKAFSLRTAKELTGDWGGVRNELEEAGITFKIKLMNEIMTNIHGGRETKNGHDFAGSYELNLYLDFEKMGWIDGATLFIRGKGTWGGDDSDFDKEKVGGFFKTNQDVGNEEPIYVDKWWWTQRLAGDRVEIRLGRLQPFKDLFDTSKIIGNEDDQFLNRALVRNETIPTNKGLGLYVHWQVTDTAYVRAAAIDAHSRDRQTNFNTAFHDEDEFRIYGELGCEPKLPSSKGDLWGRYRAGTWFDPRTKERFFDTLGGRLANRYDSNDWGFYCGFDQMIWKENDDPKDKQGLACAGRYGYASGEVNQIEHFWSVAAQYEGLIPTRDKDVLAFGVAQGIMADEYRRVHARADRETVYELYYAFHVAPWLVISPDFQYITNTGGDKNDPHTMVAGMRFKMSL